MSRATKEQQLIDALTTIGLKENTTKFRSGKYRAFERITSPGTFYFVGHAGALRVGKSIKESYRVLDSYKESLLKKAEGIRAKKLAEVTAALWVKSHAEEMTGYAHAAGKRAF